MHRGESYRRCFARPAPGSPLPGNCFDWSSWADADAALREEDALIATLDADRLPSRLAARILLAPTGAIQEVSLSSGWAYEFLAPRRAVRSGQGASLRPGHLVAAAPQPTADSRLTRPAGSGRGPPRRFPEHPGRIGGPPPSVGSSVHGTLPRPPFGRSPSDIMSFQNFNFPQVQQDLDLTLDEADLYSHAATLPLREEFAAALDGRNDPGPGREYGEGQVRVHHRPAPAGIAAVAGGSCRPLLRSRANRRSGSGPRRRMRLHHHQVGEAIRAHRSADRDRGAKIDHLRSGLGQCTASMYAAQLFNQQSALSIEAVFGVITTGRAWKFLRLRQSVLTLDVKEYYIDNAGKILGILTHVVRDA